MGEVELREHIEVLLREHERSIQLRFDATVARADRDHAELQRQAVEYERRLANLNHEGAQLKSMQERYVIRETFDNYIKEQVSTAKHLSTMLSDTRVQLEKASDETARRMETSIADLQQQSRIRTGEKAGSSEMWTRILAATAVVASLVSVTVSLFR